MSVVDCDVRVTSGDRQTQSTHLLMFPRAQGGSKFENKPRALVVCTCLVSVSFQTH